MTLLLVGNCAQRPEALAAMLRRLFQNADIHTEADPLTAVQFALAHLVDIVFAEWTMKRMSGRQLCEIVIQTNPAARAFLIGRQEAFDGCPDDLTRLFGLLCTPVTEAALLEALKPICI